MTEKIYVGVDVCKARLDVATTGSNEVLHFGNDAKGIASLIKWAKKLGPEMVGMESTGGYEKLLLKALHEAKIVCARLEPRRVRRFAECRGRFAKTDPIDARMIAEFIKAVPARPTEPKRVQVEQLEELNARRSALIAMRTSEHNRAAHYTQKGAIASAKATAQFLKMQIRTLEKQITACVRADAQLRAQDELQQRQVGVGPVTSAILIARMPELGSLNRKQVASLAGLAPFNHDSDQHHGMRFIRGGRHDVRTALYMSALSAIRYDTTISAVYARHRSHAKPHKVAIVACMRLVLTRLNAQIREARTTQTLAAHA